MRPSPMSDSTGAPHSGSLLSRGATETASPQRLLVRRDVVLAFASWIHVRGRADAAPIDIGAAGATANGRPLKGPAEAFEYVNSQRLLRDAGNPPGRWSVILIAAPASMPAEALGPWLGAVANAQQRFGVVLLHDQPPLVSATAGVVARGARCSCPRVVLDPKGMSLRGRLWGDVASRAATAQEDAPLALDPGYFWEVRGADVTLVRGTPVDPRRPGQDP